MKRAAGPGQARAQPLGGDTPSQRRARLDNHMRALNTQFSSWLQRQLSQCPHESWAQEVQQYITYTRVIQDDFSDVLEADTGLKETTTHAALPGVSGGAASLSFLTATVPPPAPTPMSAPSPLAPPSFLSGGAPPTGFQFNFSAGGGISPFAANPFGGAPGAIAEPAGQAEEDGDDEPQRPPSPSVVRSKGEDDGEETVFDGKAKFLALINKEWINKGVGNLQLRRPKDAPTGVPGARLLLYNQAGKLALNAKLYAGMKVKQADDKGVALVLVNGVQAAGEEDGAARKPVQTMIRVKDGATAKELIRQIEQHVPLR